MASILIKDIPKPLHKRLKELAKAHHRSMNKEVIVLLEAALNEAGMVKEFGPAVKLKFPLTQDFIDKAKSEGRL